jgi:hypothetical protein
MWISLRLSRHLRLGVPWWLAILFYPVIVVGYAIALLLYLVAMLLTGVAWLVIWPFTRTPHRRAVTPRGGGQFRLEIPHPRGLARVWPAHLVEMVDHTQVRDARSNYGRGRFRPDTLPSLRHRWRSMGLRADELHHRLLRATPREMPHLAASAVRVAPHPSMRVRDLVSDVAHLFPPAVMAYMFAMPGTRLRRACSRLCRRLLPRPAEPRKVREVCGCNGWPRAVP